MVLTALVRFPMTCSPTMRRLSVMRVVAPEACPQTRLPSGLWRPGPARARSIPSQRPRAEVAPRHRADLHHAKAKPLVEPQVDLVHRLQIARHAGRGDPVEHVP